MSGQKQKIAFKLYQNRGGAICGLLRHFNSGKISIHETPLFAGNMKPMDAIALSYLNKRTVV
jgi:hypothetical protein